MISTATALELLGPTFKYTTRIMGAEPDATGTITGDVFLLGTWDPTLAASDMDELAEALAKRGVKQITGDILVGSDPTRDGIYRGMVPIEIKAGEPGQPPTATTPANFDLDHRRSHGEDRQEGAQAPEAHVQDRGHHRRRQEAHQAHDRRHDRQGRRDDLPALHARAHGRRRSLAARRAARPRHRVSGDTRVMELGDFIGDSVETHSACRSSSRATIARAPGDRPQGQQVEHQLARRPRDHDGGRAARSARRRRWRSRSTRCTSGCSATRSSARTTSRSTPARASRTARASRRRSS